MKKNTHTGLSAVLLVGLLLALLPPLASAQDPPFEPEEKACISYAYTQSELHFFLLGQNASLFGSKLNINHNCQEVSIYIDGQFQASSSTNFSINVEPGVHQITLESDGINRTFKDVSFFPDRLNWQYEYQELQDSKPQFIELELSAIRTNWAVGIGILMVWVLSTYVYWTLINSYVQRNFIEEVVQ